MDNSNEMLKKKRARGANFTARENITLLSIISKYKHAIENKKTDAVSTEKKNATWKNITAEFNASSPQCIHRSLDSLKKYYENKKKEVRKQKAEERKETILTGGGALPTLEKDSSQDIILSLMDPLTVVGDHNQFDSDSVPIPCIATTSNDVIYEINEQDIVINDGSQVTNLQTQNVISQSEPCESSADGAEILQEQLVQDTWKKHTIPDLQKPLSATLKRPHCQASTSTSNKYDSSRRRPVGTVVRTLTSNVLAEKYNQLVDKKNVIADYTVQKTKLELEQMKEEHKLKCELLQLEIELKKRQLEN